MRLAQLGVCTVCQGRGGAQLLLDPPVRGHRLPGDGGEGQASVSRFGEQASKVRCERTLHPEPHLPCTPLPVLRNGGRSGAGCLPDIFILCCRSCFSFKQKLVLKTVMTLVSGICNSDSYKTSFLPP